MTEAMGTPTTETRGEQRLVLLDGVRGLAALIVMIYHLGNFHPFFDPFSRGYLFVDFFFMLSGFVLCLAMEPRFARGMTTRAFMRKRIIRLWPTIALGACIGAMVTGLAEGWTQVPALLALALLLVPLMWGENYAFPLNGPQWSLLLEVIGNLVHGLVLRRCSLAVLVGICLASAVLLAMVTFTLAPQMAGPRAANWYLALPRLFFAYTAGIAFGRLWQRGTLRVAVDWRLAVLLLVLMPPSVSLMPVSFAAADVIGMVVLIPVLFWLAACSTAPARHEAWLGWLGSISFPLYAFHLPVLTLMVPEGASGLQAALAPVVAIALASLYAALSASSGARTLAAWFRPRPPVPALPDPRT